ncbi:MAG: hypothetical protein IKN17_10735 [Ruminococcus sp.]|nr:hypothetical protein [Ruminococcus sp.]
MTGTYKMAGKVIEVTSLYEDVHRYCADYRCEGEPDITVKITQEDIDYERERSARTDEVRERKPLHAPDHLLERLAVYRRIAETAPQYGIFLFHGSCVAVDGQGYLFTAVSGTGKSTHSRLWREMLGERAVMVNDDKPLISVTGDAVLVHGTPYNGKHRLSTDISVPLKALCVLQRAEQNSIRRISKSEAFPMLMQQVYRPADSAALAQTLDLISALADRVPLYRLGANMDPDAARVAYEGMK